MWIDLYREPNLDNTPASLYNNATLGASALTANNWETESWISKPYIRLNYQDMSHGKKNYLPF